MTRLRQAYEAMLDAMMRAWTTCKLVVHAIRNGTHATGGYLPPGPLWVRNTTSRPAPVLAPPSTGGRGSSDHRNGHLGQRRG